MGYTIFPDLAPKMVVIANVLYQLYLLYTQRSIFRLFLIFAKKWKIGAYGMGKYFSVQFI